MLPTRHRLNLRQAALFFRFPYKRHFQNVSVYWTFSSATAAEKTLSPLLVSASPLQTQQFAQAAIVVSKKVAPTAVQRNHIKRLLRVLLRELLPTLSPGLQLVIMVKKTQVAEDLAQLKHDLISCLPKTP